MAIKIPNLLESTAAHGIVANANAINDANFVINHASDMYDTLYGSTIDGKQSTINEFLYKQIQSKFINASGSYDNSELEKLKTRVDNLTINQQYDLTNPILPSNIRIIGDTSEFLYDTDKQCTKIFGTIKLVCPRKSSWYVNIAIYEGYDTNGIVRANDQQYALATNMFIIYNNTDECIFNVNVPIYAKSISLTEYAIPDIPQKVSDLENDFKFVSTKLSDTDDETLVIEIKNKK